MPVHLSRQVAPLFSPPGCCCQAVCPCFPTAYGTKVEDQTLVTSSQKGNVFFTRKEAPLSRNDHGDIIPTAIDNILNFFRIQFDVEDYLYCRREMALQCRSC